MRATWLADVLRGAGLQVVEMPYWKTRGGEMGGINGVVAHHTATGPNWSDQSVANLLRDGRSDLKGPLSQLGLDRQGRYWIIASGRSNHNGHGQWGNDSIGIEAFNNGIDEPWGTTQLNAYYKGSAAILKHLGYNYDRVKGHKETDPTRKVDPRNVNMNDFRVHVKNLLAPPPPPVVCDPPKFTGTLEENTVRATVEVPTGADGNGWTMLSKPWSQYRGISVQGFDPPYMKAYLNPHVTAHDVGGQIRIVVTGWLPNSKAVTHVNLATN